MSILFDGQYANGVSRAARDIILKHTPVRRATPREDYSGTDAVVDACRWQVRVRHHRHLHDYPDDLTFRLSTTFGNSSEVDRILAGTYTADRFLYGFATVDNDGIEAWRIIDMVNIGALHRGAITAAIDDARTNRDGSRFVVIDANDIPAAVVDAHGFAVQGVLL